MQTRLMPVYSGSLRLSRRNAVICATAAPTRKPNRANGARRTDPTAFLDAAVDNADKQDCCQAGDVERKEPDLCQGLQISRTSLPPEVERLAGGFTDAPEACGPLTGVAKWWRYQGL